MSSKPTREAERSIHPYDIPDPQPRRDSQKTYGRFARPVPASTGRATTGSSSAESHISVAPSPVIQRTPASNSRQDGLPPIYAQSKASTIPRKEKRISDVNGPVVKRRKIGRPSTTSTTKDTLLAKRSTITPKTTHPTSGRGRESVLSIGSSSKGKRGKVDDGEDEEETEPIEWDKVSERRHSESHSSGLQRRPSEASTSRRQSRPKESTSLRPTMSRPSSSTSRPPNGPMQDVYDITSPDPDPDPGPPEIVTQPTNHGLIFANITSDPNTPVDVLPKRKNRMRRHVDTPVFLGARRAERKKISARPLPKVALDDLLAKRMDEEDSHIHRCLPPTLILESPSYLFERSIDDGKTWTRLEHPEAHNHIVEVRGADKSLRAALHVRFDLDETTSYTWWTPNVNPTSITLSITRLHLLAKINVSDADGRWLISSEQPQDVIMNGFRRKDGSTIRLTLRKALRRSWFLSPFTKPRNIREKSIETEAEVLGQADIASPVTEPPVALESGPIVQKSPRPDSETPKDNTAVLIRNANAHTPQSVDEPPDKVIAIPVEPINDPTTPPVDIPTVHNDEDLSADHHIGPSDWARPMTVDDDDDDYSSHGRPDESRHARRRAFLAELIPALDSKYDGGKSRPVMREHEDHHLTAVYHIDDRHLVVAITWTRFTYEYGPMYFTDQKQYLIAYIHQYGDLIIRHNAGNALKLHFTRLFQDGRLSPPTSQKRDGVKQALRVLVEINRAWGTWSTSRGDR